MADDGDIDDLLEGINDLDATLFGRPRKSTPPKNMLSSILSGQSDNPRRSGGVSFQDPARPPSQPTSKPSLDDLFGSSSTPAQPAGQTSTTRQPRRNAPQSLNDLFGSGGGGGGGGGGGRRNEPAAVAPVRQEPAQVAVSYEAPEINKVDQSRIQRLEQEIERLNRELDDVKQKKRDDEEDLERLWKDRLDNSRREHEKVVEDIRSTNAKNLEKLLAEHSVELDRMSSNYNRQLESLTTSVGQTKDIVTVVEKVNTISDSIERLAFDVNKKTVENQEKNDSNISLREDSLRVRENALKQDIEKFEVEKMKVHELNIRLNELVKQQEVSNKSEKWKNTEEWKKLNVERQVFKEDQKFILENLSRDKHQFEKNVATFYKDQHELLVRVSTERQLLEQDKNEFNAKRNIDIRRIKDEASELDWRIRQVSVAEKSLTESKTVYEAKFRQLQNLEISLMEECAEIERIRNQTYHNAQPYGRESNSLSTARSDFDINFDNATKKQSESVRANLRKHTEFLEKYVGQKVATVAPHNS